MLSNLVPKTCYLACLLRLIWHLGYIERCRGTWEHTEGDLGLPGSDFYRFGTDFEASICELLAHFGTKIVFFGMRDCRSGFLMISGSESGCLGLQNQAFGIGCVAKKGFSCLLGFC